MAGRLAQYPSSSAVDAVAEFGVDTESATLWVLPRSGKLAYGYDGFSRALWDELLISSDGSAGRAWQQLRNEFAIQRMNQSPWTLARDEFWIRAQRRPLIVEYCSSSVYAW